MIDFRDEGVSMVILAKQSRTAKSRLGLTPDEARRTALLLAATTIRKALAAESVGAVLVVTSDEAIAVDAIAIGADVVLEPRPLGMIPAAVLGRHHALHARPQAPVAILVADLPHLRAEDLDAAVDEFREHGVPLYVPDHHRCGTTMLIHGPDQMMGIGFGYQSASLHSRLGYREARRPERGLRTDLDTPEDLAAAAWSATPTATVAS